MNPKRVPWPLPEPHPWVVNLHHQPCDVRVDRGTDWGNPYVPGVHGTRLQCIAKFENHVLSSPRLMARLPELRAKRLGCWCWPDPCHAEVLARLANE